MRGVDVACVVLLVRHQLNPVLLIGNHITETVAFHILRQSGRCKDAVHPLLENLLILSEDPLLLQLQLQCLTLGKPKRDISHGNPALSEVSLSVPKGVLIHLHSSIPKRPLTAELSF